MSNIGKDPLLSIARGLIGLTMALLGAVAAALMLLIVAGLTFKREFLISQVAEKGIPDQGYPALLVLVALVAVLCVLGILFLRHLFRIVGSVGSGDPFNPINADRLRAMAWLTLGAQPLLWAIGAAAHWFARYGADAHPDVGISLSGFLLAVVLFILARVFRTGAQMREDLEGTV
jgi:hypothetical protein